MTFRILLESGDALLTETGDALLQENTAVTLRAAPLPAMGLLSVSTSTAAITVQTSGELLYKATPAGGDLLLFLTTAGALAAKLSAGAGDRRVSIGAGGAWVAT